MDDKTIGKRIRALRRQAGLSLDNVAARSELTKSALSKIEIGKSSPPVSTLVRIAKALNVQLASFFTTIGRERLISVTRKGQGTIITPDGGSCGYAYEALAADMPAKTLEPFILTVEPGETLKGSRHPGCEFLFVLSGHLEIIVEGQSEKLAPGDSVCFDCSQSHAVRALSSRKARILNVLDARLGAEQPHALPKRSWKKTNRLAQS